MQREFFCVNHFGETDFYTQLKPKNYVLNAPEMWMDDVEEAHRKKGEKLFTAISERTQWNITLFLPVQARKYQRWQNKVGTNPLIKVCYFNTTPVEGFSNFVYWLIHKNLGLPRPHNVLIPSIALACNMGFRTIYLTGADHSWLKDLWVTNDNQVLLTQKHFYDKDTAQARPMDKLGKGERKLYEILQKFVYAFKGYFVLLEFSKKKNIEIINMTEGSYIDAFERFHESI